MYILKAHSYVVNVKEGYGWTVSKEFVVTDVHMLKEDPAISEFTYKGVQYTTATVNIKSDKPLPA